MTTKKAQYTVDNGTDFDIYHFETDEDMVKATAQSIGDNGYKKLPGGLILQWGTFTTAQSEFKDSNTANASNCGKSFAFPIAFPNKTLSVNMDVTGMLHTSGERSLMYHEFFDAKMSVKHGYTTSQFVASVTREANTIGGLWQYSVVCDWFAIGY